MRNRRVVLPLLFCCAASLACRFSRAAQIEARLSAARVAAYGHVEVQFPDTFNVDNPDDPRQAGVEGVFVSPSGQEWRMPGFLYQDFERKGDTIIARGKSEWRVRFTPVEPGKWKASVQAKAGAKTFSAEAGLFEVTPAKARGFLRRSKTNPLALEFENGEPLIAIGSNVFPKTTLGQPVGSQRATDVIRYLGRTAAAGGTFCRLRMDSWFIPIEMTRDKPTGYEGAGRYHAQSCWEVDRVIEAAERLDITLLLCISNANANVNSSKKESRVRYNFYLKENGGFLDSNGQFWTDPEVKRLFLQKMRYCVARWGASSSIGVWEFFNEVKLTPEKIAEIAAWHRDMTAQWRALDPYKRPIACSPIGGYSPADYWWRFFKEPAFDLIQYHTYGYPDLARGIGSDNLDIMRRADRPLLVGEFGSYVKLREELGNKGSDKELDPAGVHLHNGIWAAGLTGAVGALPWFITNYIDTLDLYHVFTGFSRFAADWKINEGPWRPIQASIAADAQTLGDQRWTAFTLPSHGKFARPETELYRVNRDGTMGGASQVSSLLWGVVAHKDYRLPPVFEVDYPVDGQFIVQVRHVFGKAGKPAPVIVQLDGKEVLRKDFPVGEGQGKKATHIPAYDNWDIAYDAPLSIDVPAGRHRIRVDYQGTDRAQVDYTLTRYVDGSQSVYRVYAMGLGDKMRLWVQNAQNTHANLYHKKPPAEKPPAVVRVPVEKPGRYEAEWWDTYKGAPTRRVTVETKNGALALDFPGTLTDEACKIRYLP